MCEGFPSHKIINSTPLQYLPIFAKKSLTNGRRYVIICKYEFDPMYGKGGEKEMATIKVGENESLDSALRRFKRRCARDGIIGDLRKKEQYEKPSVRRKKKAEAARKRSKM